MTEISPDSNIPQTSAALGIQVDMDFLARYSATAAQQGSYRERALNSAQDHYLHLVRIVGDLASLADGPHAIPSQVFDATDRAKELGKDLDATGSALAASEVSVAVGETSKPLRDTQNSVGHLGALAKTLAETLAPLKDTLEAMEGHNSGAARGVQQIRQTSRAASKAAHQYSSKTQK